MSAFASAPRVTPFLWFDNDAEQAVTFYMSVFKNSRRLDEPSTEPASHPPKGVPLTIAFELDGQRFTALNGGPYFKFNEAVSFVVRCDNQDEIDFYWSKLSEGGTESRCGWLKDRFGLSWQIVPVRFTELMNKPAVMQAVMGMTKFNIAELERAAQA